jgi:hypothetical protein
MPGVPNWSVHRSVAASSSPRKMILPLYQTIHAWFVIITAHPASVNTQLPNREAMDRSGMICPVRTNGSPIMWMSHMCVDITWQPSTRDTLSGIIVSHLLTAEVPSMTKIWVAPESAMASSVVRRNVAPAISFCMIWARAWDFKDWDMLDDMLEAGAVTLSLSSSTLTVLLHNWVGYNKDLVLT